MLKKRIFTKLRDIGKAVDAKKADFVWLSIISPKIKAKVHLMPCKTLIKNVTLSPVTSMPFTCFVFYRLFKEGKRFPLAPDFMVIIHGS